MVDGMTLAIIGLALGSFALGMGICNIINNVYGEQYKFNMTEDLEKETRLLQACIAFNLELEECDMIYGSIPK